MAQGRGAGSRESLRRWLVGRLVLRGTSLQADGLLSGRLRRRREEGLNVAAGQRLLTGRHQMVGTWRLGRSGWNQAPPIPGQGWAAARALDEHQLLGRQCAHQTTYGTGGPGFVQFQSHRGVAQKQSSATHQPTSITPSPQRTDQPPSSTIAVMVKAIPALRRGQRGRP